MTSLDWFQSGVTHHEISRKIAGHRKKNGIRTFWFVHGVQFQPDQSDLISSDLLFERTHWPKACQQICATDSDAQNR